MKTVMSWALAIIIGLVMLAIFAWVGLTSFANLSSMSKLERGYVIAASIGLGAIVWYLGKIQDALNELRNEVRYLKRLIERDR